MDSEDVDRSVSVITSIYHGEKYLSHFFESVKKQTILDDIEIVIDHNEPTPGELEIIEKFDKICPGVIRHHIVERRIPYGASWNNCIKNASGKYLAIWNVDDARSADSLRIQRDFLETHQDIGVVFGKYMIVNDIGRMEGRVVDFSDVDEMEFKRNFYLGPFFMFRKDLIAISGYVDEQFRSSADYDFGIRLAHHTRIGSVDDVLGFFLDEGKGLSTNSRSPLKIEDTAIKMRYGVFDEVSLKNVPFALQYKMFSSVQFGKNVHIGQYLLKKGTLNQFEVLKKIGGMLINNVNPTYFENKHRKKR